MQKRCLIVFCAFMLMFCASFFCLNHLCTKEQLSTAAANQQCYKLKISDVRGTIYDCRNIPLVNYTTKLVAAAVPCAETLTALTPAIYPHQAEELYKKCSLKTPFTIEVFKKIECPYVQIFEVPIRYSGITLAPHIVGYLSGDKSGTSGIEKSYDEYLSHNKQEITMRYNVDATGKLLPGTKQTAVDRTYLKSSGVQLTLDGRIQAIAEETANKHMERGAVIISEVPNCEIRACCSLPSFTPNSVDKYLKDEHSPLLNRAFCSFNLGSVFKLITAAAAMECGIKPETTYNCEGANHVDDAAFKCYHSKAHGTVDMAQAMAHSCNGYFVELIKNMPNDALLKMAKKFHLGDKIILAPYLESSSGKLPTEKDLENIKNLANFSFGQGKLLATPLQIAGIINTIASGGVYSQPKLVQNILGENMKPIKQIENHSEIKSEKVISETTAEKLKIQMKASVDYGTGQKAKPESEEAAGKTSTAQTGIIENGKKIEQSWFAGFFPFEKPKYCVVVLSEAGSGGGESCGPVFKEIADRLKSELPALFMD